MSRQAKKMQFLILQKNNNNFLANRDVLLLYLLVLAEGRPLVDFCLRFAFPNRETVKKYL